MLLTDIRNGMTIYKGHSKYKIRLGSTWKYEIYNEKEDRIFKTDDDNNVSEELKGYSIYNNTTCGYAWDKTAEHTYRIYSKGYLYTFTTTIKPEEYITSNKQSIDNYFKDIILLEKEKQLNAKLDEFKNMLGHQNAAVIAYIDELNKVGLNNDLFLAELSKEYANNFKYICSKFTDSKLLQKVKALFNNK